MLPYAPQDCSSLDRLAAQRTALLRSRLIKTGICTFYHVLVSSLSWLSFPLLFFAPDKTSPSHWLGLQSTKGSLGYMYLLVEQTGWFASSRVMHTKWLDRDQLLIIMAYLKTCRTCAWGIFKSCGWMKRQCSKRYWGRPFYQIGLKWSSRLNSPSYRWLWAAIYFSVVELLWR